MSCGLALAAVLLLSDPNLVVAAAAVPVADAPVSVAGEPLFADIVDRSIGLKSVVDDWIARQPGQSDFVGASDFPGFKTQAQALAALDMQAHLVLKDRGVDGDLKCILRGISEDLPKKLDAVETATTPEARNAALTELAYLLNDNAEVITAPPQPEI